MTSRVLSRWLFLSSKKFVKNNWWGLGKREPLLIIRWRVCLPCLNFLKKLPCLNFFRKFKHGKKLILDSSPMHGRTDPRVTDRGNKLRAPSEARIKNRHTLSLFVSLLVMFTFTVWRFLMLLLDDVVEYRLWIISMFVLLSTSFRTWCVY